MDAKELKKIIDDIGVAAVNAHVSILNMENDLDAEIEYANILGMKTITIPALPNEIRNDVKALLKVSNIMNYGINIVLIMVAMQLILFVCLNTYC